MLQSCWQRIVTAKSNWDEIASSCVPCHNSSSTKLQSLTLSTASHKNPKAEGLVKIMLDKNVMAFILLLQVITCTQMYVLLVRDVIFLSCIMYKNECQSM